MNFCGNLCWIRARCIVETAGWLGLEDVKWDRALAIHLAVCIWRADAGRDDNAVMRIFPMTFFHFVLQRVQTSNLNMKSYEII